MQGMWFGVVQDGSSGELNLIEIETEHPTAQPELARQGAEGDSNGN